MLIINIPYRIRGESVAHFRSKKRIARIADEFLSSKYPGMKIYTIIEFPFEPVMTDVGRREYKGDIVLFFINPYLSFLEQIYCIEVDGKVGHGNIWNKRKDSIRDNALKSGITLPADMEEILKYPDLETEDVYNCPTLRISAFLKGVDDFDIEKEIDQFVEKH